MPSKCALDRMRTWFQRSSRKKGSAARILLILRPSSATWDFDPVLRRGAIIATDVKGRFGPRLYRRRDQNVEKVLNVARSERGSIVDTCHSRSVVIRRRHRICSGSREDRAYRCFVGSLGAVG